MKKLINKAITKLNTDDCYDVIREILMHPDCAHEVKVRFALGCAERALQHVDRTKEPKAYRASVDCIEAIKRWLVDRKSVSNDKLKRLGDTAAAVGNASADYTAYVTYTAADAVYAADNAYAAVDAAYLAASAVKDVIYATAQRENLLELLKLIVNLNEYKLLNVLYT